MGKPHIVSIVGARPNFVKLAALSPELRKVAKETIIHTGQHYDYELSKIFFDQMGIPEPGSHLGIIANTHGKQTGEMLIAIETTLDLKHPDAIIVFGDTNSTLAGALAAAKLHIPVIHIEAGVRSYDKRMPEELNRIMVDHIADMLFVPTCNAAHNAISENISASNIFECGDVMVDLLTKEPLKLLNFGDCGEYYLLTIHREENDNLNILKEIFKGLSRIAPDTIIFPCHPRIRKYITALKLSKNIKVIDPVGYFEMRHLERNALGIITDSGGVQKEAYLLGIPCITLRKNTEWIETLDGNWNVLTNGSSEEIRKALGLIQDKDKYHPEVFGKSGVCERISHSIVEELNG
jgi:UDP-N-acetylglucosamine 2-epimerase